MNDLVLYKSERFYGVECDVWRDNNQDIYMTRDQIGRALEYSSPNNAIRKIHERNFDRINKFSRVAQLDLSSGGKQDMYLYNTRGIYEICRWSKQRKAHEFIDWVWNLLEGIRTNEIQLLQKQLEDSQPKLQFYQQVCDGYNHMTMLQASKLLKISGRNKLFKILREEGILMNKGERHNLPYQQFLEAGYFSVVVKPMIINSVIVNIPITLVSPKGLAYIQKRIKKKELLKTVQK